MSRGTLDTGLSSQLSHTGLLPSMVSAFHLLILLALQNHYASPQPRTTLLVLLVWALPRSLATTYGISFDFFSCGYLDVSVPHVSLPYTMYSCTGTRHLPQVGFPIRTSTDRWLFAPPRSFSQLVASFIGFWCQGIHPMLLVA